MRYDVKDYIEFTNLNDLLTQKPAFKSIFIDFYAKHNPDKLTPKECLKHVHKMLLENNGDTLITDLALSDYGCDSEVYEDFFFTYMSSEVGFHMFDWRTDSSSGETTYELRLLTVTLETKAQAITFLRKAIEDLGVNLEDVFAESI